MLPSKCLCWIPAIDNPNDGTVFIVDCDYVQATNCGSSCEWYCDPVTFSWRQENACPENCECDPPEIPCDCDNICTTEYTPCYGFTTTTTTTSTTTTPPPQIDCGKCSWFCGCKRENGNVIWFWSQIKSCAHAEACDCPFPEEECTVEIACETKNFDCILSDEWLILPQPTGDCGLCKYKKVAEYEFVLDEYGCTLGCDCPRAFSGLRIRNPYFWISCDLDGGVFPMTVIQNYHLEEGYILIIEPTFTIGPIIAEPVIYPGTFDYFEFDFTVIQNYYVGQGYIPDPAYIEIDASLTQNYHIYPGEIILAKDILDFTCLYEYDVEVNLNEIVPEDIVFDISLTQNYYISTDGGIEFYDPCASGTCLYVWHVGKWHIIENLCPCHCFPPTSPGSYNGEVKRGTCKLLLPIKLDANVVQTYHIYEGELVTIPVDLITASLEANYHIYPGEIKDEEPPECHGWCVYYWDGSQWVKVGSFCNCECYPPTNPGTRQGEFAYGECR